MCTGRVWYTRRKVDAETVCNLLRAMRGSIPRRCMLWTWGRFSFLSQFQSTPSREASSLASATVRFGFSQFVEFSVSFDGPPELIKLKQQSIAGGWEGNDPGFDSPSEAPVALVVDATNPFMKRRLGAGVRFPAGNCEVIPQLTRDPGQSDVREPKPTAKFHIGVGHGFHVDSGQEASVVNVPHELSIRRLVAYENQDNHGHLSNFQPQRAQLSGPWMFNALARVFDTYTGMDRLLRPYPPGSRVSSLSPTLFGHNGQQNENEIQQACTCAPVVYCGRLLAKLGFDSPSTLRTRKKWQKDLRNFGAPMMSGTQRASEGIACALVVVITTGVPRVGSSRPAPVPAVDPTRGHGCGYPPIGGGLAGTRDSTATRHRWLLDAPMSRA
ncbi:hypothetical protein C8R47DRAFT_1075236 [Mycena vitilis]|nr:hypothetical protein C8R47DRAFT_1075236 [Mycena vitilis]